MKLLVLVCSFGLILYSCSKSVEQNTGTSSDKFNVQESDPAAVELADSIMIVAGGDENWSKTKFISWSAPERKLIWDTQNGRLRMEDQAEKIVYLIDLNTGDGRVQHAGQEVTDATERRNMLAKARFIWFNDIYALALPFRLKTAGVTLKYMGEDSLKGDLYNVLQLSFANQGTNQDKYKVYVDIKGKVIKYWAYFADVNQDTASFVRTWTNDKFGHVMLSTNGVLDVKVEENLPVSTFTEF